MVREKPWADLIVSVRVVERGLWTNAELNERERWWINHLRPRLNHDHNLHNPNRIRIPVQHEQRKLRDPSWVMPDWRRPAAVSGRLGTLAGRLAATLPFRAFVSWLLAALAVCVAVAWGSHAVGHRLPVEAALAAGAVTALVVHVKYWKRIRRQLRRL